MTLLFAHSSLLKKAILTILLAYKDLLRCEPADYQDYPVPNKSHFDEDGRQRAVGYSSVKLHEVGQG